MAIMQKIYIILMVLSCTSAVWEQNLTTKGLQNTFMDRCDLFHGTDMARDTAKVGRLYTKGSFDDNHCKQLWDEFEKAVSGKDPCSINIVSYNKFLELANDQLISRSYKDKIIFWSGGPCKEAADDLGSKTKKYLAMKQFFQGFIFDAVLWWCGEKGKGFKWSKGPEDEERCTSNGAFCSPNEQFWEAGSKMLGEMSEGIAYVLFNAYDTRGPYRENSIFGKQELPALIASKKTTEVRVILYSENNKYPSKTKSKCNHQSLISLKNEVEKKGSNIKYTCQEDPRDFMKEICKASGKSNCSIL